MVNRALIQVTGGLRKNLRRDYTKNQSIISSRADN